MKPERANVYLIGRKYTIIEKKIYELVELDDEGIVEALFNNGDCLPLFSPPSTVPVR